MLNIFIVEASLSAETESPRYVRRDEMALWLRPGDGEAVDHLPTYRSVDNAALNLNNLFNESRINYVY